MRRSYGGGWMVDDKEIKVVIALLRMISVIVVACIAASVFLLLWAIR